MYAHLYCTVHTCAGHSLATWGQVRESRSLFLSPAWSGADRGGSHAYILLLQLNLALASFYWQAKITYLSKVMGARRRDWSPANPCVKKDGPVLLDCAFAVDHETRTGSRHGAYVKEDFPEPLAVFLFRWTPYYESRSFPFPSVRYMYGVQSIFNTSGAACSYCTPQLVPAWLLAWLHVATWPKHS